MPSSARIRFGMQHTVVGLLFTAGLVNFLDRGSLSVANLQVRAQLHLSGAGIGALLSIFSLSYGFAQVPVGALLDRWGARALLGWGLLVWSAAQAATALVGSFAQFVPLRVLLGVGESPFFPAGVQSIEGWFAPAARGRPVGWMNASTMLGQAIAPPLLTALMLAYGWRVMFVVIGALGVALAGLWFGFYRDPARVGDFSRSPAPGARTSTPGILSLLRSPVIWGMVLGFSGINYTAWLYLAWLPGYLELARHVSLARTGWLAALPFLMAACGMLGSGWAADSLVRNGFDPLRSRRVLILCGMVLSAASTYAVASAQTTRAAVLLVGGALFCVHIAGTAAWGLVQAVAPPGRVASVAALQNFGSFMVASVAPWLTGFLLDRTHSFRLALLVCSGVTLGGAVAYAFLVRQPVSFGESRRAPSEVL